MTRPMYIHTDFAALLIRALNDYYDHGRIVEMIERPHRWEAEMRRVELGLPIMASDWSEEEEAAAQRDLAEGRNGERAFNERTGR